MKKVIGTFTAAFTMALTPVLVFAAEKPEVVDVATKCAGAACGGGCNM
jgi:hypothetical protein